MYPLISKRISVIIISLSIFFSQVSWWALVNTGKIQKYLRPEIQITLEKGKTVTIASLPTTIILPLITYMPFWLVVISVIHIFKTLEKRRTRDPLRA